MLRLAIVLAVCLLPVSAAGGQTPVPQGESTERARTLARVATLTAFRKSNTFERVAAMQRQIASVSDPAVLAALHDSLDLSEETQLSPITELYYLLKAEVVFVQLRNPEKESLPTADALEQLSGYADLRRQQVQDPTTWLAYQVLSGMYALQKNRKADAESHLRVFEAFTERFNVPDDAVYVEQMRRHIASGDVQAARRTMGERMATFFPQQFDEVRTALDDKIVAMKAMAGSPP